MTHQLLKATFLSLLISIPGVAASVETDIKFSAQELYPEGITFDANTDQFLVSSMRHGKIGRVSRDGVYHAFINDPILVSSVGMHIDSARNRLLVAVSDPGVAITTKIETQSKLAGLAIYDLKSGKRLAYHDLGGLSNGVHFANDITVDTEGNIYVTDSFSPIVYKIGKQGKPSIFVQSDFFMGEGFNLNGIVYHPDGYLISAKSNSGELFKISLKGDVTKIKIQQSFNGGDGLILMLDGSLAIIQNSGKISRLISSDNWVSATVSQTLKTGLEFPTTGVLVGKNLYVLNAKLGELFDPNAKKSDEFSIRPISFQTKP